MLSKLKDKLKQYPFKLRLSISSLTVFMMFTTLVASNFIVLVAYTLYSQHESRLADSDEVTIHVANILYLLEASSKEQWQHIAKDASTEELKVSLTSRPRWHLQIKEPSVEQIHSSLEKTLDKLAVSILLPNEQWLNVRFSPNSNVQLLPLFILFLGLVVAIALLFSAWSLVRFTEPLKRFKKAAEQLGVELQADPVIEYGPAIVRETAHAMNQMQKRIRSLLDDRNRMLAAISHDLRTPITRLKLRAQFVADPEQYREIVADLTEMELMVDQILAYTRDAYSQEPFIDLDLAALVFALCDEKCEQGYAVECPSTVGRLPFKGRALALKRALINLLNNAVIHAEHVEVSIDVQEDHLCIIIDDDGIGIPDELLAKVFTPFYRVDYTRSTKTGGTGLGLAIAQDIIHAHQGSVQLHNRAEGGLRVIVTLPLGERLNLKNDLKAA